MCSSQKPDEAGTIISPHFMKQRNQDTGGLCNFPKITDLINSRAKFKHRTGGSGSVLLTTATRNGLKSALLGCELSRAGMVTATLTHLVMAELALTKYCLIELNRTFSVR